MISQLWIWNVAGYADLLVNEYVEQTVILAADDLLSLCMIQRNIVVYIQRLLCLDGRLWKAGNGVVILNAEIFHRKKMDVMMSEQQNISECCEQSPVVWKCDCDPTKYCGHDVEKIWCVICGRTVYGSDTESIARWNAFETDEPVVPANFQGLL